VQLAARLFGTLAAVFLAAMMLLTVADVFLRAFFSYPIQGMLELVELIGALISLGVLVVMAWQMVPLARTMHEFGDVTSDLSIPKLWYWIPVLLGVVASALATLVFIVRWRRRG
jgi:TRAP-type C4-dicarboxylate transport system permease small subunit